MLKMTVRFIPVYTGNIQLRHLALMQYTVYPCVYREHVLPSRAGHCGGGLSLCIQGTFYIKCNLDPYSRFIPVYTGNICNPDHVPASLPVYPCVYREHTPLSEKIRVRTGLSLCIQGT